MNKIGKVARGIGAFARQFGHTRQSPIQPTQPTKEPSIGLALGGGFARGLSHIGVLKVLEQEGIPVRFVAGTSVGSVIGAAYCSGISAKELEEIAALVRFKHFARWTISRLGIATNDRMSGFLRKMLKVHTFEELKIPLAVTATDFVTGDAVVFRSGDLIEPVRASCAYPGMFLPVNIDGRLLIDGLLGHAVPTVPLREMGADRVIGVYLSAHWVNLSGPRHVFDVIGQCFSIAQQKMCGLWESAADVIITPDVRGFSYDGFERAPELIAAGEKVARAALPQIESWLAKPKEAKVKLPAGVIAPVHP
ncbi:MAG TPA: patatin-like phospholipase family protein [Terriglobales bacterium]|nr:patatin-like phospholipase family protein [Terriglobales bacterium]